MPVVSTLAQINSTVCKKLHHLDTALIEGQYGLFACRERDGTEVGDDEAIVFYLFTNERDIAAERGIDGAAVDHCTVGIEHFVEDVIAIHEIGRGDVQPRGDDAADIDHRCRSKNDAIGIDQDDLTVGVDTTGDGGAVIAENAVEGNRRAVRLDLLDTLIDIDIVRLPVDGHVPSGLINRRCRAGLADGTAAAHHLPASGTGQNIATGAGEQCAQHGCGERLS